MPVSLEAYYSKYRDPAFTGARKAGMLIFAKCRVDTAAECYGNRDRGKLIFPVGTFDIALTRLNLISLWRMIISTKYILSQHILQNIYSVNM